jgi:hypothetical protein
MPSIESDFSAELAQIQAESIGWIPLEEGVYLVVSKNSLTPKIGYKFCLIDKSGLI